MGLDSPRFFRMARLLSRYDGAVRSALIRDREAADEVTPTTAQAAVAAAREEESLPDITSIVAMSQQPGFPSIAYTSGG